MSTMTEPETTFSALDSLAADAAAGYKTLVISTSRGDIPSPKKIRDVLALVGCSVDEFKKQVELLQKRLAATAVLAEFSEKQVEVTKLGAEVEAAKKVLDDMEVAYRNARQPVHTKYCELMNEFQGQADAVRFARTNALITLEQTATPAIAARRRAIQQRQKKFIGLDRKIIDGPTAVKEREAIAAELRELERRELDPIDGIAW